VLALGVEGLDEHKLGRGGMMGDKVTLVTAIRKRPKLNCGNSM
jgi:hypothetical protein